MTAGKSPDDFYYLGKILRHHGNNGDLLIHLEVDTPEDYQNLESVYVDLEHERIPFFIGSIEIQEKKKAIIHFEKVDSPEHAAAFQGRTLFLPLEQLPKLSGNQFYYHEVIGYRVSDKEKGWIGTIQSVLDLPQQALFQIDHDGKEILIPVTDEVIIHLDRHERILYIEAPEGLIDIYL